jgi:hypothetical protein
MKGGRDQSAGKGGFVSVFRGVIQASDQPRPAALAAAILADELRRREKRLSRPGPNSPATAENVPGSARLIRKVSM